MSPPGVLDQGFHPRPARVVIGQFDVLDVRHLDDVDLKLLAADSTRRDVVAKRFPYAGEDKLESTTLELPLHGSLLPVNAARKLGEQLHSGGLETDRIRGYEQVGALADRGIARFDDDLVKRRRARFQPACPQFGRAVAPVAGAGVAEPKQEGKRGDGDPQVGEDPPNAGNIPGRRCLGDPPGVFGK